jgi:hypothetical protein
MPFIQQDWFNNIVTFLNLMLDVDYFNFNIPDINVCIHHRLTFILK